MLKPKTEINPLLSICQPLNYFLMKNYKLPNPIVQLFRDYFEAVYFVELTDSEGRLRWSKIVCCLLLIFLVISLCQHYYQLGYTEGLQSRLK